MSVPPRPPVATYRLQFHRGFTFAQAAEIIPYLQQLGVSHCYASPYLRARAGSQHGYDIVDHNALNPEVGNSADYENFVATLHAHGLGQILDIVPNHMGVGGDDNHWWMDVLENGPASAYAGYFDIDWNPPKEDLRGKLLSPVLGDHYGKMLDNGEIRLVFEAEQGVLAVRYHAHRFPLDPRTYPAVLEHEQVRLEAMLGTEHPALTDFASLITALRNLPPRTETSEERIKERRRDKEVHKHRLAQLARERPEIRRFIEENVAVFNGTGPARFDPLHDLLEAQAFRLSYWRVASDEINYRRFFDINDLAGLCTEKPEVFEATHRLIFELIERGQVDGLRIDHPDGMYDPAQYYERLAQRIAAQVPGAPADSGTSPPLYVVAEKILATHERLPENWRVHGTTGYDFAGLVNGLFVQPAAERALDRIYRHFAGPPAPLDDQLYESKRLVMRTVLSSELHVLANYLDRISESDRLTRDFTHTAQRAALFEVVACFPVYRTYVTGERVTDEDRRYVDWAIAAAKRRSTAADVSIFDFIRRILLLEDLEGRDDAYRRAVVEFAMRFQQFTGPVMAKGLEDTLFYRYHRLASLNEVGGDPRRFAVSPAAFHRANQERLRRWPHAMLTTSTHDTKRSEDVRARLNVLSELAPEWRMRLGRWNRINRARRRRLADGWAPDANDEYFFYQTLLGVWPETAPDATTLEVLRERVEACLLKAIREAKVHTSWINPNAEYEEGVLAFARALLRPARRRRLFLDDFQGFARRVARLGRFNSLSQTLLKLTSPGIPDLYQGNELWDFSLMDPDNRRPVDYALHRRRLEELQPLPRLDPAARAAALRTFLDRPDEGRAKLYLTWRTLSLRRTQPAWFAAGDYLPLKTEGARADHLIAYARVHAGRAIIVATPRWFASLAPDQGSLPLGPEIWTDTWIESPGLETETDYMDAFSGAILNPTEREGQLRFSAGDLFRHFPVALLVPKVISF